jgi:hypothetical protein
MPGRFDRDAIRTFFVNNYEASTNYNEFADALIAVWESSLSS